MKVFVSASYASKVNYETGEVFLEHKQWLEEILNSIEELDHTVFCALRADQYRINDTDPVDAFSLDMKNIKDSDVILALLDEKVSTGVQTEVGVGIALNKMVILAHDPQNKLRYFNAAMVKAGVVQELELPLEETSLKKAFALTRG